MLHRGNDWLTVTPNEYVTQRSTHELNRWYFQYLPEVLSGEKQHRFNVLNTPLSRDEAAT